MDKNKEIKKICNILDKKGYIIYEDVERNLPFRIVKNSSPEFEKYCNFTELKEFCWDIQNG